MTNPLSANALFADVVRFAEMGDHRTGSPVDLETSEWIKKELSREGMDVELDSWPLRQFHLKESWVEVFGHVYDAFPLWHPTSARPEPLNARLVHMQDPEGVSGNIVLVQFPEIMVTPKSCHAALIDGLAKDGALAVIGCAPHASGSIYGQNVIPPYHQKPWPIPVLMIAPSDWHVFDHAASRRNRVSFMLTGEDVHGATANNVVARLDRGRRWLVVSTPQSGWFRCAGERGAGVALLLGIARWAAASDLEQSLLFISNSGHEIGHMGAFHTLAQDWLPSPDDCDCWLHLGSCIATVNFTERNTVLVPSGPAPTSWLFSSGNMIDLLQDTFAELTHLEPAVYDRDHGEIRWILERGYEAFALMGPQQFFHLRGDGPEVVEPELLEQVGEAIKATLERAAGDIARSAVRHSG